MLPRILRSVRQGWSSSRGFADTAATSPAKAWYEECEVDVKQIFKKIMRMIQQTGPVRERHLQELVLRCHDSSDLGWVVRVAEAQRRARVAHQQYRPLNYHTSRLLLTKLEEVGEPDLAMDLLTRARQLGVQAARTDYHTWMIAASQKGDMERVLQLYTAMTANGVRPGPETSFVLSRACARTGHLHLLPDIAREFEVNGVRMRQGVPEGMLQKAQQEQEGQKRSGAEPSS